MLLRFAVRNHLSLRDWQEISLVGSRLKDDETSLIEVRDPSVRAALPVAMIYGANASGKTNILDAVRYMQDHVLGSHASGKPDGGVPRQAFQLSRNWKEKETEFDIEFIHHGVRYHYAYGTDGVSFLHESLFSFPEGKRRKLFVREGRNFQFGQSLRGRNQTIKDLTRPNSLFLSSAAQNDHPQLSEVWSFFKMIRGVQVLDAPGSMALEAFSNAERAEKTINFLNMIGTGVSGWRRKELKSSPQGRELFEAIRAVFSEKAGFELPDIVDQREVIEFAHLNEDREEVFFPLRRESAGTRRLVVVLSQIFDALDTGGPVFVDELDASLHTQAAEAVVALFADPVLNQNGAQLVATTHDTNLLRSSFLRRDEIWFCEKEIDGATTLYPLSDIRTRSGENLEKSYLEGRFGGLPDTRCLRAFLENF